MFKIESVNPDEEGKVLTLSEDLFHVALRDDPQSKARYHVINDRGEDFDIVYWDNDLDLEPRESYPAYVKPRTWPPTTSTTSMTGTPSTSTSSRGSPTWRSRS